MDSWVQISDSSFKDIQLVPCKADGFAKVSDKFCAARWNFDRGSIYLNERTEVLEREVDILVNQSETGFWKLRARASYVVFGSRADHPSVLKESSLRRSTLEDGASRIASLLQWDGVTYDGSVISGYEACLRIDGTSELSKLDLSSFVHQPVRFLPESYDGNVIFELPPASREELSKKGGSLSGMDRGNDCWLWTKCITTSAQIGGKKSQYAVNKIHCVGSLKCINNVDIDDVEKMSRIAIHVGKHSHPHRRVCSRGHISSVKAIVAETLETSPQFTPGQVRAAVSQRVFQKMLEGLGADGLTRAETCDLLDSLAPKLDFQENVLMPNANAAESVHASWQRTSKKKQQSLLEVTMEDNPRALIQIARGHSFRMGRGGGTGPSLFELYLRVADRLGTPDAFEKAFDSAVRQTEPLKDVQATINGDLATKTQKRKTPVTNTIHAEDTHRHDRIAVTAQVQRRVRSHLELDIGDTVPTTPGNFEAGQSAPQGKTGTDPADITTISTSSDISTPDLEENVVNKYQPIVLEEGEHDPNPVPTVDFVEPISETESEVEIIRHTRQQAPRQSTEDDGEPDVVILRVTPRSRPPTRKFPRPAKQVPPPVQIRREGEVTQFGLPVQEQNVDRRFWHLSRINPAGNPACNAAMTGRGAPCFVCKTKIKIAGLTVRGFGTIAPSFVGFTRFQGTERQNQFWFCPKYVCVKSQGSPSCKLQMPPVPEVMPVITGTNLSQAEVDFLGAKGFVLVHRLPQAVPNIVGRPSIVDIRINVDTYPQKVQSVPLDFRYNARGTKGCRRKTTPSKECNKRVQSALTSVMMLNGTWDIHEGNGCRKMFRVSTHLHADVRNYIVQICCFPTCSCQDFFEMETLRNSYIPCKHLYWVYFKVLGLSPNINLVHQPIFSKKELELIISYQTKSADERQNVHFELF
ncbi:hypothetical protein R1sor_024499 [Riccia sorocarpa]|uniref:SWIM-type domain-containing protein n=1 Tax=Riccia sorocarpa TaxID=122646 RepID=A0ABD3GQR8_9MARC